MSYRSLDPAVSPAANPHLGVRLRQNRESKGMTQQDLELAIEASFGHISRIESGKVNPSKETLLKIADTLHLSQTESLDLLGVPRDPVAADEVRQAIGHTREYLKTCPNPAYLLDDFWFVWVGSEVLMDLVKAPKGPDREDFVTQMSGKHALEWIFSPVMGFRPLMAEAAWHKLAHDHCLYVMDEFDYSLRRGQIWLTKLVSELGRYPDFQEIWSQAGKEHRLGQYHRHGYSITFMRDNKPISYVISHTKVVSYPRFSLIEYVPA